MRMHSNNATKMGHWNYVELNDVAMDDENTKQFYTTSK